MDLSGPGPWRNGRNRHDRMVTAVFLPKVELHRHARSRTDQFPMYVVGEADAFSLDAAAQPELTPVAGGSHFHNPPDAPHAFLPKVGQPIPDDWEIAFIAITPRNLREDTQSVSDEVRSVVPPRRRHGGAARRVTHCRPGGITAHAKPDIRLHRRRRRLGRLGAGQPAERRPAAQGAGAGSRARKPSLVVDPGRLRQADRQPQGELALFLGADEGTGQRRIPIPRGKLLGGSSSINGMVFVRGQAQDYDTWAQLGNRGWSYREVLPIFRDMESFQGDADEDYRGRNGPLKVTESNESGALYDALIKAAGQVGINYTKDYNGAKQDGIGMTQTTIRGGRRMSTAVCYLDPARTRPNLTIVANALTEGLLFDGKRCVGVRYTVHGQQREARATREVVVSAGSINSPQLLELSGIGQPERLKAVGIEVRHELKGVGENLRDHYSPRMKWTVPPALGMTYNDKMRGLGRVSRRCATRSPARGCSACRRRRSAPISAPAPGWRRLTRRSPGSRSWWARTSSWPRPPASPRS